MATDPDSLVGQNDAIHDALSGFYKDMSTALENNTSFPSINSILGGLTFTQLQTLAYNTIYSKGNFMSGSAVETIHMVGALLREYNMRAKNKSEYYLEGQADHANESDYYDKLKYSRKSMLLNQGGNGSLTQ